VNVPRVFTCRSHHRALHRVGNEVAWWKAAGVDPVKVARALWRRSRLTDGQGRLQDDFPKPGMQTKSSDAARPWSEPVVEGRKEQDATTKTFYAFAAYAKPSAVLVDDFNACKAGHDRYAERQLVEVQRPADAMHGRFQSRWFLARYERCLLRKNASERAPSERQ
jgi:hypothetical protein